MIVVTTSTKKKTFSKFLLWFTFLSTLGVGGGIFFLLFAVVPIEQNYTDRGWSQFKIDSIMKYYVIGWVVFGFIASFIYYKFIVAKEKWKLSITFAVATIALCCGALYYFLNTGSALVQGSQGEVVEGDRFTFGPYPEQEDIERLYEEGYDGIITLLNPTLPIEKPLLDKEKRNAEEAGMALHSLPMLPWVGDNSESIEKVKQLIQQDDKRYYVHCYLGRHRVDVIKQVINEELGETYKLLFLQPTTLERGSLFYFNEEQILIGPFPTDEEWFTRISRAEVEEVISVLEPRHEKWLEKERQVTTELGMQFTHMPISANPTVAEIEEVGAYAKSLGHKSFVHGLTKIRPLEMLEASISWGKTLDYSKELQLDVDNYSTIGAKWIVGEVPATNDQRQLHAIGIEEIVKVTDTSFQAIYQQLSKLKNSQTLVYLEVPDEQAYEKVKRVAIGLLFGSLERGVEWKNTTLTNGELIRHERNLVIGPLFTEEEYEQFALKNGVAQLIYLYAASTTAHQQVENVKMLATQYGIPLKVIPMASGYEEQLIPLLQEENGLNYIMTDDELLMFVNDFIKRF